MSGISTVTTKGQVTIPKLLRKHLNVSVGDKVYFEAESGSDSVKLKKVTNVVDQLGGSLYSPDIKYEDLETVREKVGRELGKQYDIK